MRFILASNNQKKLTELRAILSELGVEVISQRDAGFALEPEENGGSFEANAMIKARAVMEASGEAAIADDTGLVVDALGGEPGVYSARYGGEECKSDRDRYMLLLSRMEDKEQRSARFVTSICCIFPNGDVIKTEGKCEGEILRAPSGSNGFGYDPVFRPRGKQCSMAELNAEEKNSISHRGNALRELKERLRGYYNADK